MKTGILFSCFVPSLASHSRHEILHECNVREMFFFYTRLGYGDAWAGKTTGVITSQETKGINLRGPRSGVRHGAESSQASRDARRRSQGRRRKMFIHTNDCMTCRRLSENMAATFAWNRE